MKSLYLRIYLTVVLALALFAVVSGWLVQRHLEQQRSRAELVVRDRMSVWADMLQRALPPANADQAEQQAALEEWSQRLRAPLALDDPSGRRVAISESFQRRQAEGSPTIARLLPVRLDDGRTIWVTRPAAFRAAREMGGPPISGPAGPAGGSVRGGPGFGPGGPGLGGGPGDLRVPWFGLRGLPDGVGLAALLVVLFLAVAAGAYPVVRGLTRRLESLKHGVEAFGAGALHQRVAEDGRDEVAAVGASFNRAASRIEALITANRSLLANASHELRSPLARLKMAVAMLEEAQPAQRELLKREIDTNIAELDSLVEEVLLASRLDGSGQTPQRTPVQLLAVLAEEAARVQAEVQVDAAGAGASLTVQGEERLLRRALRNLLENARRHGGGEVEVRLAALPGQVLVHVCDRGPGVPEAYRERIFEAFFRLPGQSERDGGVGLGLALVRQIAQRHQGQVRCLPREGGGSCFEFSLPRS